MTEEKGHFEQGRWVVDPEIIAPQASENVIDKRLSDATLSVATSIDEMVKVTHDLIATEEGKQYIDRTMKELQAEFQKSLEQIIGRAKDELAKTTKPGK